MRTAYYILEEFLDNAVSTHAHEIRINLLQKSEDSFSMTVEDDGEGIPEEDLNYAPTSCDYSNQTWVMYSRVQSRPGEYIRVGVLYADIVKMQRGRAYRNAAAHLFWYW